MKYLMDWLRSLVSKNKSLFDETPDERAKRLGLDLPVGSDFPRVDVKRPYGGLGLDYKASDLNPASPPWERYATVEIDIRRPGQTSIRRTYTVEPSFFEPLPEDRELPFAHDSHERTASLLRKREVILAMVAHKIAVSLLEALASRDHMFGYSPEEWGVITRGIKRDESKTKLP